MFRVYSIVKGLLVFAMRLLWKTTALLIGMLSLVRDGGDHSFVAQYLTSALHGGNYIFFLMSFVTEEAKKIFHFSRCRHIYDHIAHQRSPAPNRYQSNTIILAPQGLPAQQPRSSRQSLLRSNRDGDPAGQNGRHRYRQTLDRQLQRRYDHGSIVHA